MRQIDRNDAAHEQTEATDTMTYDGADDTLMDGSWQPESGLWSLATRTAADAGAVCGDGG